MAVLGCSPCCPSLRQENGQVHQPHSGSRSPQPRTRHNALCTSQAHGCCCCHKALLWQVTQPRVPGCVPSQVLRFPVTILKPVFLQPKRRSQHVDLSIWATITRSQDYENSTTGHRLLGTHSEEEKMEIQNDDLMGTKPLEFLSSYLP